MMAAQPRVVFSNRYEVIAQLGAGSMGTVYSAHDRLTGQRVALKQMVIRTEKRRTSSRPTSAVLAQEFKFLASLRHPNIISVLDYGFDAQSQPFYTMTLMEGAREFGLVADQQDIHGKIDLLLQVLQALAYLHRRGILHRDLKPANVLVNSDDVVKVVDFGLAAIAGQDNAQAGTLVYMAPEVLRGESATIQSDLYAVGIMAYELFAGKRPFDAPTPLTLMYRAFEEAPDLRPLNIDPALVAVIEKLLSPTVEARYTRADEVIQAFAGATGQPLVIETQATRESFLQAARFVGRDNELKLLNESLREAADSKGSTWLIGGESGVGKSRLVDELQTQALLMGALVLRGQAVAEAGTPYQIWRNALRRLMLQTELTDFEASVLKPLVPDIERLLNREVPDTPEIDAQALQLRLLLVIESMFRQQRQLIVLLLEDLHWADDSLLLLKRLNELANELPLLIIGTYRTDETHTLPEALLTLRQIKLERLSSDAIELLSVSMLGEAGKSQPVIDLLKRETEGNVFFIIEVVRTLAEEAGRLSDVGSKTLPTQVFAGGMQTVIRRRLDKVPEWARPLMTLAAVGGREIDLKILHVLMPTLDLDNWLQQVATVIEVQDNRYRFAHDKLREGILKSLETDDQRRMHRDIAQAIETAYPDSAEHYPALAYHWGQAQDAAKTIHSATLAGEQALRSGSYREAIRFFEQALALTDQTELDPRQLSRLHYLNGDAYWGQSDTIKSSEQHFKGLRLIGFLVPEKRWQLALGCLKLVLKHAGRRVLRLRGHSEDEMLLTAARSFEQISKNCYHDADFLLGVYTILSAINAVERAQDSPEALRLRAQYYTTLGFATGDIGIHPIARSYIGLAEQLLKTNPHPETMSWFKFAYGIYLGGLGQWERSNLLMEEARQLTKAAGNLGLWVETTQFIIWMFTLQSRFTDALAYMESILPIALRDERVQAMSRLYISKGHVLLLQGKMSEARAAYFDNESAIEAALKVGDQTVSRIGSCSLLTTLYTHAEDWDTALKYAKTLDKLIAKAQTLSVILANAACASIALYLTLWEKQGDESYRQVADTMLKVFHKKYTRPYNIGQAVEASYRCWYYGLAGHEQQANAEGLKAVEAAQTYQMPYYEAFAHYQWGRFMAKDDPKRAEHLTAALTLFEQMGATYNVACVCEALVSPPVRLTPRR